MISIIVDHGTSAHTASSSSTSSWQPPPELQHSLSTGSGQNLLSDLRGHNKENEDVNFMSSDSSSSSSSDE